MVCHTGHDEPRKSRHLSQSVPRMPANLSRNPRGTHQDVPFHETPEGHIRTSPFARGTHQDVPFRLSRGISANQYPECHANLSRNPRGTHQDVPFHIQPLQSRPPLFLPHHVSAITRSLSPEACVRAPMIVSSAFDAAAPTVRVFSLYGSVETSFPYSA